MKKAVFAVLILIIPLFLCINTSAQTYEFSFDEDESADGVYEEYLDKLPEDIKDKLCEDTKDYGFEYFANAVLSALKDSAGKALGILTKLVGAVILSATAGILSHNLCPGADTKAFSLCSSLCIAILMWDIFTGVADTAQVLLQTLSNVMMMLVPAMEGILIYSGNLGAAAVSGTGINLMIAFGETVFSKVLFPGAVICFFLAVSFAVSKNYGISFMSKTLRGLVTGTLIAVMALMSFVLALQNMTAGAADTFAVRTVKFAISSYLPIVGGTVSESFSCLAGSMNVLKQTCGVTGIVVLLTVLVPPFILLIADRLSIAAAEALAGMLGCEREKTILSEAGGICTLLIAICAGAAVMFIIAIGMFCRTVPALS